MKSLISFKFASSASILIYSLLLIFHIALIIGAGIFDLIPIDTAWGGKMESQEQLIVFEFVALIVVLLCLFLTLVKIGHIKIPTKIFWGEHEAILDTKNAENLHERLPNSELEIFGNCGHFVYQDDYTRFTNLIRTWVNKHA